MSELSEALKAVAEALGAQEEYIRVYVYLDYPDTFRALARDIGGEREIERGDHYASVKTHHGPAKSLIDISIQRDKVCHKVKKLVEVETWECDSILEPRPDRAPVRLPNLPPETNALGGA